jgi:hypothetical protein
MNPINRKRFLKAGAILPMALHCLQSRGHQAIKASPRRLVVICNSLGFYQPYFYPSQRGDWSTSRYLRDMPCQPKMTVFENFFHAGMETSNHDSEKSFLTGQPHPESSHFVNGISLDQLLAEKLGDQTRFPSLSLSLYDRGWGCSWDRRGSAIAPMNNAEKIFETLFGAEDLAARQRQIRQDQTILAALKKDLDRGQDSGQSRAEIELSRQVFEQLEARLQHERFWLNTQKPTVDHQLISDPEFEFSAKIANLFDLTKLALQTDSTRLITLSLDWVYGAIRVPGATGGWHTLSHHGGEQSVIEKLSRIETDIMKHFRRWIHEMDQVDEGDGTLLDHTTVVLGSNFEDASNHTCHRLPLLVAGGSHRHKGHTVLEQPTPLSNLYLELLNHFGVDAPSFGNSQRNMGLLTA